MLDANVLVHALLDERKVSPDRATAIDAALDRAGVVVRRFDDGGLKSVYIPRSPTISYGAQAEQPQS